MPDANAMMHGTLLILRVFRFVCRPALTRIPFDSMADHVITDDEKRANYLRLFMLRCYMSQVPPERDGPLRPHYAFVLEKSKYAMGSKSVRSASFLLLNVCDCYA